MISFVILLLAPIFVQHFVVGNKNTDPEKRNKVALMLFFLLFTVLVMFRHESVGNDTRNYLSYFNRYARMDWSNIGKETAEIGFSYLNKIISVFTGRGEIFLAVVAFLTVAMLYRTYKRLVLDSSLTIVLFCTMSTFVMMFSGIRQMLAVGIGCVAYEFVRNKKIVWFLLSVFLAMTFHMSAFMLFFMYPVYHAKITKKLLFVILPGLLFVFVFNKPIFAVLTSIIARFTKYEGQVTFTGAYTMLALFSVFAIFAFVIPDEKMLDNETMGLRNLLLLSVALQMFAPLHMLAMRMNYYYIIFIPLLMPKIIACRSEQMKQVAVVGRYIMVIFFLGYFFWNARRGGGLHVFPYHFFWEAI